MCIRDRLDSLHWPPINYRPNHDEQDVALATKVSSFLTQEPRVELFDHLSSCPLVVGVTSVILRWAMPSGVEPSTAVGWKRVAVNYILRYIQRGVFGQELAALCLGKQLPVRIQRLVYR